MKMQKTIEAPEQIIRNAVKKCLKEFENDNGIIHQNIPVIFGGHIERKGGVLNIPEIVLQQFKRESGTEI